MHRKCAMLAMPISEMDNYKSAVATMTALVADANTIGEYRRKVGLRIIEDSTIVWRDLRAWKALWSLGRLPFTAEDWRDVGWTCVRGCSR